MVERNGPQGFEYQYLATLCCSLLYVNQKSVEIYIEDEEDCKITFYVDNQKETVFLQMKKTTSPLSLELLLSWLGHFDNRSEDVFLFSKLLSDNCTVVFVTTARCEDILQNMISKFDALFSMKNTSFTTKQAEMIKEKAIICYGKTKNPKRKNSLLSFIENLDSKALKAIFTKIKIIEQADSDKISEVIKKNLSSIFSIQMHKSESLVLNELADLIKTGRDSRIDIAPELKKILDKHIIRLSRLSRTEYVKPPKEDELINILAKENVLLLTGLSRCGKTSTARSIVDYFGRIGYQTKETRELFGDDGAYSFLNSYADDKRVLLLEDPFGAIEPEAKSQEIFEQITKLLSESISPTRKIVITSRSDFIKLNYTNSSLDICSIGKYRWHDISMNSLKFAYNNWEHFFGNTIQSKNYFSNLVKIFRSERRGTFLEVGEIKSLHLKFPSIAQLAQISCNEAISTANVTVEQVVKTINAKGDETVLVFIALGLCVNTIRLVTIENLGFLLSNAEERPALREEAYNRFTSYSLLGTAEKTYTPPTYQSTYQICDKTLCILKEFEMLGYIYKEKHSNKIGFAHPIFYQASKMLFCDKLNNSWTNEKIKSLSEKSLGLLSKESNLCALDNFNYAIQYVEERLFLIELFFTALKTIYPAVQDYALQILSNNYKHLSGEYKNKLITSVQLQSFNRDYSWCNNEAYLVNNKLNTPPPPASIAFMNYDLSNLGGFSKGNRPPVKEIYHALCSNKKDELSLEILQYSILFDESIIKEKAIYLLFKNYPKSFQITKKYLKTFQNDFVLVSMIQGSMQSWNQYSDSDKEEIENIFISHMERQLLLLHVENFLVKIFDECSFFSVKINELSELDFSKLCNTWFKFASKLLEKFQTIELQINEAKFFYLSEKYIVKCSDKEIQYNFFENWINYIETTPEPTDSALAIMDIMLATILVDDTNRIILFAQMLTTGKTSLITSHISHAVNNWKKISKDERLEVEKIISSDRNDLQWIKAVILTRRKIPKELKLTLFLKKPKSIFMWVEQLRETALLEFALNMHTGHPQPIWWNGYHHQSKRFWSKIISHILKSSIFDTSYKLALKEFMVYEFNRRDFPNSEFIWENILSIKEKRALVFEELLRIQCTHNQANKKIWSAFFNSCESKEKECYIKKLLTYTPAIERYRYTLDTFFDANLFWDDILPQLEAEFTIVKTLVPLLKVNMLDEKLSQYVVQYIIIIIECEVQTLFLAKLLESVCEKHKLSQDLLNRVEDESKRITKVGYAQYKIFDDQYQLSNWNN